jgi:hypothetical protein
MATGELSMLDLWRWTVACIVRRNQIWWEWVWWEREWDHDW